MTRRAFLFPGQGSQRRGMGEALFDAVPEYAAVERHADALMGCSLRELCVLDSQNQLGQTRYTQPAMYVVNALHFYKALADGLQPDAVAGHSLGEYNALLAAGVFDFLTGLSLVKKRGELMGEARGGAMSAIKGLGPAQIADVLRAEGLLGIDVANFNSPQQTVISGPLDELKRAVGPIERAGAEMCIPLPVSAAFHSRYMAPAARAFDAFLSTVCFATPRLPVISNATGRPYPSGNPRATVRSLLVKQILQPVQWTQTVRYLRHAGVTQFNELGTGQVLSRLVEQTRVDC